ncbi:uncharacterized protein BT62DRAFT_973724 [Guyanagaster necrorhizus]|uniref:Uncharacterized protein n=1 Tax=Guyanagaster necrorhizus TaxID=856835 RepID=A0A9P7VL52_9AGAR|nr:uncharacterized protein BT62DRAFT_973724 [Guyanagaster necrorhizus MCA 3950]KAG7442497.1 hypothetical protein BT62DRAFT_973724 [Guyanagaster necrorhizus MCA 3950]
MHSDEHPLSLELSSLKVAVSRFQDEAHSASVKLQRHSLNTSNSHERLIQLERENAVLKSELNILRANPHPDTSESHPAVVQSQELTLALRRLSDKLSLTEDALFERTTELAHASAELTKAKDTAEVAYALAARIRGREEDGKVRERDLENQLREAQEHNKMSDLVVTEYADYVRSFDDGGRTSSMSPRLPPNTSLSEAKSGIHKLFEDFSSEAEELQARVDHLEGELAIVHSKYEAEIRNKENDRVELAKAQAALEKLTLEDNSAAKMVSRYMKFSQAVTNRLQASLVFMKERHAATVNTLNTQISVLSSQLEQSRANTEKLRLALDEVGGDVMREAFGRRREIALRLRMVAREESIEEWLRRWALRAEEGIGRGDDASMLLERMLRDAHGFAAGLDGPSETMGRIIVAENAVETLVEELRIQTARRLELEKLVVLPTIPALQKNLPEPPISEESGEDQEEEVKAALLEAEEPEPSQDQLKTVRFHQPSPRVASAPQSTSIFDELASSESSSSSSTLITMDSVPFPSKEEPFLLAELQQVSRRYDDMQRAFRDCHHALQDLKNQLLATNSSQVLHTATDRLNDYAEDAQVELEIRIADEALLARGFETILTVSGALSDKSGESRILEEFQDLEAQIDAFVSGSDPAVKKAQQNLSQKLDDIQHDIAAIKRALHDPELLSPIPPSPSPATTTGWMSWVSRPSSPSPSPTTFGNVMTSPKLRQAQPMNFQTRKDPYASLGLRVSMPSLSPPVSSPDQDYTWRERFLENRGPRPRTLSAMYSLGLARNASGTLLGGGFIPPTPSQENHVEDDSEEDEDDVE